MPAYQRAARLHRRRVPAARRATRVGLDKLPNGAGLVRVQRAQTHHHRHDARRRSTRSAWTKSRASTARSRKVMAAGRLQGLAAGLLQVHADRHALQLQERGRAARALPRARSEDQPADPGAVLADARRRRSRSARSSRSAPKSAAGGEYQAPERGRHASRHLLRQHLRPADAQDLGRRGPVPARGDPRPPLPDRAAAGADRPAEVPPLRRRDRLRRRLGPVRRIAGQGPGRVHRSRTTTSATCRTSCGARSAWSSTPACTARAGPASR